MRAWQIKHICSGVSMLLDLMTVPHHAQTTSYAGFGFLSFV